MTGSLHRWKTFAFYPRGMALSALVSYLVAWSEVYAQLRYEYPMTVDAAANTPAYTLTAMPGGGVIAGNGKGGQVTFFDAPGGFPVARSPYCAVSSDTVFCVDGSGDTNHLIVKIQLGGLISGFSSPSYVVDPSVGAETDYVRDLKIQPSGKVLVANDYRGGVYRLTANGSLDGSFPRLQGSRILMLPDGRFLLNADPRRYTVDGVRDTSFADVTLDGACNDLALAPDGSVIIVGTFGKVNGSSKPNVARLLANGTLDSSFQPFSSAQAAFTRVAVQSDGKILCGNRVNVIRINGNGTIDRSFIITTGHNDIRDFCIDSQQRVVFSSDSQPLTRLSGRNRVVVEPSNIAVGLERSSAIETGWSLLQTVSAGARGDYIDDGFPGSGNSFFRAQPTL